MPKLIIPAIQTNIRLGSFGKPSEGGIQFIKVPINMLRQDKGDGRFKKITSKYFATGQLSKEDIDIAKEHGFRSIVCFRPDNEGSNQPKAEDLKSYADSHNIQFVHIPIASMNGITENKIQNFTEYYDTLPSPILGFCKGGGRAVKMWQLMKQVQQQKSSNSETCCSISKNEVTQEAGCS